MHTPYDVLSTGLLTSQPQLACSSQTTSSLSMKPAPVPYTSMSARLDMVLECQRCPGEAEGPAHTCISYQCSLVCLKEVCCIDMTHL